MKLIREGKMNEDFAEVWSDIQRRLMSGTLVRFWSPEKGYSGGSFHIDDVADAAVIVRHGQSGRGRRLSKRDFQHLFASWGTYNHGITGRIDARSDNTGYILSILQWRDETQISTPSTERMSLLRIPPQPEAVLASGSAGRDDYGKWVLHEATEGRATFSGPSVDIEYGAGSPARIDATVGDIAVVIASGVARQVRGAVLDLICHPYPKKLLVLLPDHMTSRGITGEQCRNILGRFCPEALLHVLVLKGSGGSQQLIEDTATMAAVLADLRSGRLARRP
jgi:hypothetical protein